MKTLPIGPALAFARTSAGLPQQKIGHGSHVCNVETGVKVPRVTSYLAMLTNAGAKLIVVTHSGEQVQVVDGAKP